MRFFKVCERSESIQKVSWILDDELNMKIVRERVFCLETGSFPLILSLCLTSVVDSARTDRRRRVESTREDEECTWYIFPLQA